MIDQLLKQTIGFLQTLPGEVPSLLTFLVAALAILMACRFGFAGLCTYNVIAVIAGNVQVLKLGVFATSARPIGLGSILFATTFLVSDIITERFSAKRARQSLLISFVAQLVFVIWMILCLAHKGDAQSLDQVAVSSSLMLLFVPQARLFAASFLSYITSQLIDIAIFQGIKRLTGEKLLWLRQNISTALSGFIDNFIFSVLAWIVLNPTPLPFKDVLVFYVFSGYILRGIINVLGTPIIYLSKKYVP